MPDVTPTARDKAWIAAVQEERRFSAARFYERRTIEWRVAFALWATYGLVANAVLSVHLDCWAKVIASVMAGAVVALHAWWVKFFMGRAAPDNWTEGIQLTHLIRVHLAIRDDEVKPVTNDERSLGYWWQVIMTALLAGFIILFIWQ